jgi:hypothetical protein
MAPHSKRAPTACRKPVIGCSPSHAWDPFQLRSTRPTNASERLNEKFRRHIKTQIVQLCAETVPMLSWALMSGNFTKN